jgi:2-polyprenyl-6-hydroxyphenyl methylase/3-demethylubiquinone-9 3-methyltransferase
MKHKDEIAKGHRFSFGENWNRFLNVLDDERIQAAEQSLRSMLAVETLAGKSFLDIGSGSGLFSLAARRLGARVHSFDYDPKSVACTTELRRRYFPNDPDWVIDEGSALDKAYFEKLGSFDVVYSWGVLHHTGQMYEAFSLVPSAVAPGGQLFIAIYNDQGFISKFWTSVKILYNAHYMTKLLLIGVFAPYLFGLRWLVRALNGRNHRATLQRGMSLWYDMIDWLGGYPFEVAKPEAVFSFFRRQGFLLEKLKTCGGRMGCNEFVFRQRD